MRKLLSISLLLLFASSQIIAGGYQVRLQGQKQTGIGLIGTPFAYGASSIFFNPGSLSFMKDTYSFSAGVSPIFSNALYRAQGSDYEAMTDNPTGTPFYFYGAGKVTEKMTVGVGVYTPFGSSVKWDKGWTGKYLIQEIALQTIFFQPTVSYKLNDKVGIGAGLCVATGSVDLTRAVPAPVNGTFNMNGNTTAYGFNAGLYLTPTEKLKIGIDYRSNMTMSIENGDTKFTEIPVALVDNFPASGNFNAELPLPANLDVGIAYDVTDKLTLAAEMNYVFWSVYDSLVIDFVENTDLLTDSRNPREYTNSMILRFGGEYRISDKIHARAGIYYDPAPTSEDYFTPETVSLNTLAFTVGLSIMPIKGLSIDLSYLQLNGMEDERMYKPDNFGGTYMTRTFVPGFGVSYSF
ncbi:MAG: outer membrane protein transport protein [Bacteroidales bacterium]|nr:outer membrane protein transport protein [Bacteroidales bacterium]MCF8402786.1 outer membrane protein transport protein [Bacteroidales bacterium]